MNDVLHVSVKENGMYSSVPWVLRIFVTIVGGRWADWMIRTERLSVTSTRKLMITISELILHSFVCCSPRNDLQIVFRKLQLPYWIALS